MSDGDGHRGAMREVRRRYAAGGVDTASEYLPTDPGPATATPITAGQLCLRVIRDRRARRLRRQQATT